MEQWTINTGYMVG